MKLLWSCWLLALSVLMWVLSFRVRGNIRLNLTVLCIDAVLIVLTLIELGWL